VARIRVSVACSISSTKSKALWWECSHKTHGGLMSQHDLRHRKLPTVDYASKFNWVCQSRVAQFHGGTCPMPCCSDGLLQFLSLALLRSCFVVRMCTGPFLFAQPTCAAHIVSISFPFNLSKICTGLGVRGKMVRTNKVERNMLYHFS
jgi:hypothetical protein